MQTYKLFLDLDGVLADFDAQVKAITGKSPSELGDKQMWPKLAKANGFFEHLPWMPDGKALWTACQPYAPVIITGLPMGNWAEVQKRAWCKRELGEHVQVVTCMAREKPIKAKAFYEAPVIPVLIDDREKYKENWEKEGGIFIVHRSTEESLAQLFALGKNFI